ncbi:MAG: DUF21 domain-containing protein [Verrucomicrobiaceae bacterium]|nr:DUF21 domain-containing protein [Verrucomicrobiaceae bacterium]
MIWLLLLILLTLSFMLSGLESAVLAVSRVRVRHAASGGDRRARRLLPLLEDRDALIGCITVANHMTNLAAFVVMALPLLHDDSLWHYAAAFMLALPVFLIGLEVMPKKLFRRYPFRSLRSVSPLLHLVGLALPLFRAFARRETPVAAPGGVLHARGRGDLKALADELASRHQLSPVATELIGRVLDYKKLSAADVMQPLTHGVALSAEMTAADALVIARGQNCMLLPVLGEDGRFIGVLDITTLPAAPASGCLVRQHMRTLDTFPATLPALHVLQRMRRQGRRLSVIVDEKDSPLGLVTEERLLEPLMH